MKQIRSTANPSVLRWQRLASDARLRRSENAALADGIHVVGSLLAGGLVARVIVVEEGCAEDPEIAPMLARDAAVSIVSTEVMRRVTGSPSSPRVFAEFAIPGAGIDVFQSSGCLFLEGIQDAGNVGTILRTAAAFGIRDVLLDAGCADAWSPKVLRAAQGAHGSVRIERRDAMAKAVLQFPGSTLAADPRATRRLDEVDLRGRVGWIFGAEGAGISTALAEVATERVRIHMAAGAESINVAAAAAICLYATSRAN